jgi:hypothetical protein
MGRNGRRDEYRDDDAAGEGERLRPDPDEEGKAGENAELPPERRAFQHPDEEKREGRERRIEQRFGERKRRVSGPRDSDREYGRNGAP